MAEVTRIPDARASGNRDPDARASAGGGPAGRSTGARSTGAGPGRLLVGAYAFFAIAAGARAGWQIATRFSEAPLAYLLSALAAGLYLVAAVGLARGGPVARRVALVCCLVELTGVLVVGAASLLLPETFPRATVWSGFGVGYGLVPLVLPVLGLLWLHRCRARA